MKQHQHDQNQAIYTTIKHTYKKYELTSNIHLYEENILSTQTIQDDKNKIQKIQNFIK